MSHRPIIDAGPGLNFLSINKERLLIGIMGQLSAPETVQTEVFRKSRQDERFRAAAVVWRKLTPTWMQVLSDDQTPELAAVVHRITRQSMEQRLKCPKDLGETMVIAHAVVAAEAGETVTVLIDDGAGARTATAEINRLQRLHASGRAVGAIRLVNTLTILARAAGGQHIPDRPTMRTIYTRLRGLDDGLPPIERTTLLGSPHWS
ncbi:PIN domain-containing protein [Actinophytocola sediminis]